jgi:hypothetical protein
MGSPSSGIICMMPHPVTTTEEPHLRYLSITGFFGTEHGEGDALPCWEYSPQPSEQSDTDQTGGESALAR